MSPFVVTLLVALTAFVLLWLMSLRTDDVSIVDVFWGPGFALLAVAATLAGNGTDPRRLFLLGLVTVWGVRLGVYLWLRNHGKREDFRYAAMRRRHGARF